MGIKFSMSNRQVKRKFSAYSRGVGSSQSGGQHYASSGNANTPLTKSIVEAYTKTGQAMGAGGGLPNVMYGQPMFFSPLHTPQNWQIASKKREIYQWTYLPYTQVIMEDFTYQNMEDIDFACENLVEDTLTGGLLYEDIDYPEIMDSEGNFRKPPRFSERECVDKRCFSFSAYGYWRELRVSEEHKIFVLDGDLYRKKKKVEGDEKYRRKVGIEPNGVKKVIVPDDLIKRVEAQNVKSNDYLLCPVPEVGTQNIKSDLAWLIGLCIADGLIYRGKDSCAVRFTGDSREKHLDECQMILQNNFFGKISKRQHGNGNGNGCRISASTLPVFNFFSKYIVNKGTKKKFTQEIFSLDKETRLHILAGYFDGDGSFSKREMKLIANNYSKDMADQLYWLLLSCGISCTLYKRKLSEDHYKTSSKYYYIISIPASEVKKLQTYMKSHKIPKDFIPKTSRELRFFYEEDGQIYFAQPISKIEQFYYTGKGYDIEMTNSRHALVADGYICSNCRFYQSNEPKVAAGIDFYSEFPLNGFVLECKDKKILKFFERTVKRLKLNYWLKAIGFERHLLGDVYPFVEYECKKCGNQGILPDGTRCNHPGGTVGRIKILNPDWITVHKNPISEEAVYMLEPDDELKGIIATKRPEAIYNSLPPALIESVSTGQPIVLSNRNISHIKYGGSPYSAYGMSMIRRMFTYLAYKTKLMTANWIVAERLILPIRIVKLGSDNRPATAADIADVSSQLVAVANDPNLTLVTHNNFDYSWEGACYSEDTEILTENGWKLFGKLEKDEKVATYNMDNKNLEYQLPTGYHEYDYDSTMFSPMYHFKNKYVDVLVTPNHRMLVERNSKMEVVYSQNVTHNDKFISTLNLENTTSEKRKDVKFNIRKKHIHRPDYIGKVYCVEVLNSMLVVRRNGMISIQGNSGKIHNITNELEEIGKEILDGFMLNQAILNGEASSYSSAQVGIEIMIARLESWRNELADWVENHIFLPIAMMQNFKDEEESKESDEDVFIYPKLKWNDLQLRDRTNFRQILMQLHDKGLISAQRLLEEFDIDYDQETRRIREEQALASATGQFLGQPQGGMGGMGGMPMGGGMGGGMPPMDIGGGGMPGMPGGEPGMPGAAPGMPGAAPAPGGMPTPMAAAQPLSPVPTFISKRGKGGKSMAEQQQEQAQQQAQQFQQSLQNIRLTTLEQKMLNGLSMLSGQIPYKFYLQYKIATAGQPQPYVLDFAYPDVGVGVEACGEVWHDQMDQKIHDQQRDQVLANIGWRILRFKEEAIDGKMPEILKVIYNNIAEAVKDKSRKVNKAASADERIKLAVPPSGMFDIDNNLKEDLKFQRIDMQDGLGHIYLVGT